MDSIRFELKQLLAFLVSASLITATVPLSSAAVIGASPLQPSRQISAFAPLSASDEEVPAQSAARAIGLKPRARLKPDGTNPGAGRTKLPVSDVAPDHPKPGDKAPANKPLANRQAAMKMATLDSGGLVFVENKGQFDARVKFQVSNAGKTLWLTQNGIVFDFVKTERNQTRALPSEVALPGENRPGQGSAGNPKVQNPGGQIAARDVIYQNFVGANDNPVIETKGVQEGIRNYLSGSDPKKWQTDVRGFSEIVYHDVWKGVDLKLYGKGSNLEQELIVAPGADLGQIQIEYEGIERLRVERRGSLLIKTSAAQMRETAPRIYQRIAGRETVVKGRFKLLSPTSYTFQIAKYNAQQPLTIDPTLLYSTYLGGSAGNGVSCGAFFCVTYNNEVATGIAVDTAGDAYVTGYTLSTDFPTTSGAFKTSAVPSAWNSFVTKLNPTGSGLIYSTYLNGASGHAFSTSISVDGNGNAYVTGYTEASTGFPTTANAYAPVCSSTDFFVTALNATGTGLVYSSCLNIDSNAANSALYGYYPRAIAVDSSGRAYVTGGTGGLVPTTSNAYQPSNPGGRGSAFVMDFDTTASGTSSLMFSTYFVVPGPADTNFGILGLGIALDSFQNIYITGSAGPYLPVTAGAFQSTLSSGACSPTSNAPVVCPNAFVAKFNPSVSGTQSLIYSTYLGAPGGTSGTLGYGIAVDSAGSAYVTGLTGSAMFPVTPGTFQTTVQGCPTGTLLQPGLGCAFVSKLSPSGSSLIYSTYLAGNSGSYGSAIAVDPFGDAYVAGNFRATGTSFFPVTPDAFQSSFFKLSGDSLNTFLTKLNAGGTALIYSSYLGGEGDDVATAIAVDQNGDAYVVGHTSSGTFPITQGAFQPIRNGTGDAFVTKFPLGAISGVSITGIIPDVGGNSGTVTAYITGSGLQANATLELVCAGQATVVAINVSVSPDGRTITGTFDLTATSPGACSVEVINPDGTNASASQPFTIEAGGTPNMWIDIVGQTSILGGSPQNFYVIYGNRGTVDAKGIVVSVETPNVLTWTLLPGQVPISESQPAGNTLRAFAVPVVPPQGSAAIVISLTGPIVPTDGTPVPFRFRAWVNPR